MKKWILYILASLSSVSPIWGTVTETDNLPDSVYVLPYTKGEAGFIWHGAQMEKHGKV